jgi:hypothetical protein
MKHSFFQVRSDELSHNFPARILSRGPTIRNKKNGYKNY